MKANTIKKIQKESITEPESRNSILRRQSPKKAG